VSKPPRIARRAEKAASVIYSDSYYVALMSWRPQRAKITAVFFVFFVFALSCSLGVVAPAIASAATIVQGSPSSGSTDVAGSAAFTDTLTASSGFVGPVTFTTGTTGFAINGSDQLVSTGTLSATGSPYAITGGDADGSGDIGTWTYSLAVTPDVIVQGNPTSGSTDVAGSAAFTDTLTASSGFVGPVTFTTGTTGFAINGSDQLVSTGTLSATGSPYAITGGDSDAYGDIGTWTYSLAVTPDIIVQGNPTSGATPVGNSENFGAVLTVTSGFIGSLTYVVTSSTPPGLTVASNGVVGTTGGLSSANSPYTISGDVSDVYGDTGAWVYTLTVAPAGTKAEIIQTSSTTGSVININSGTFAAGPITVADNTGPVTFVTTASNPGLSVSDSGLIATTGSLAAGSYGVSGTDSDTSGDTGTWSYTLIVSAAFETVTFDANGGAGEMAPESENEPSALSLNHFTWAAHTFIDWNTLANGSGVSYANGAQFSFGASTTLFAQWKVGKAREYTITFAPNGGRGRTSSETENTPTSISASRFTRAGYTFLDWDTSPKGSGSQYRAGTTYSFKKSITLFAQWVKILVAPARVVTFLANGGSGAMAAEHHRKAAPLNPNRFDRKGYTFLHWSSSANGSGVSYANGANYSFDSSTTLYAQWKKEIMIVPPVPLPKGPEIGPFGANSAILTSVLESQIDNLAANAKANGDNQISLLGYGDKLSAGNERNTALWTANIVLSRARARAVATYLATQLGALGVKSWSISIAAADSSKPGTSQPGNGIVIAMLS
jgi:hypothetical protein